MGKDWKQCYAEIQKAPTNKTEKLPQLCPSAFSALSLNLFKGELLNVPSKHKGQCNC